MFSMIRTIQSFRHLVALMAATVLAAVSATAWAQPSPDELLDRTLKLPDEEQPAVGSALMTPTTGVAVAATVAAIALLGLSQLQGPVDPLLQRAVAIDDGPAAYTEPAVEQVLADQPNEMLMQYYLSHSDSTSGLGANGIFTQVVTLELREGELVEIEPDPHLVPAEAAEPTEEESAIDRL